MDGRRGVDGEVDDEMMKKEMVMVGREMVKDGEKIDGVEVRVVDLMLSKLG